MEEKYFEELRSLYADFKSNYKTRVEEQRELTNKQIKTKGRKYDVFPYSEERIGNKTKGKEVDEIEMKDNNFIFYFDAEGRIRLVEEACTFLKRISDCECYDYVNDKIYAYYGSSVGARRICLAMYEGDKIKEKYSVYSLERCAYEKYVYNDNLLSYIETYIYEVKKEPRKWKQKFYFDKKNNLQLIQRVEGSWRENNYCSVKINNKKMETNIESQVIELQKMVFSQTSNMENLVIGVNLNLENEISDIDFFFEVNGEIQTLDKKYNLPIRDLPLDMDEMEKIVNIVLKAIMRLWDNKEISEDIGFKIIKDGINILDDKSILPRWVQKSTQLIFDKETIRYHYLDEKEKIESKKIKEIYRNFKKTANKEMRLPELVDCFIKMSKVVAKDASYEVGDDMYLMQAEVVEYNRRLMFGFSLIRQIPYKEEFFQLRMQVLFELNEANRNMSHFCWNEDVEEDFFTYVQSTDAYKLGCETPVYDVCIYLQET